MRAVLPYLAMSYLYKRSNRLWYRLIRHRLTARAWRWLVEITRRRHLKFRLRLERESGEAGLRSECVVSAGGVRGEAPRRLGVKVVRGPFGDGAMVTAPEAARATSRPGEAP